MSGLGYTFKGGWLTRRRLLQGTAGLAGAAAMGLPAFEGRAADKPQTANSLRSLTNPYHASFAKGGELFAKSVDAPYEVLVTEGNSEKGIADVRALLARTGGNLALCIDPNDSPDARVIVEECAKAGATVVTIWNKPADLHPWDFNPNYVAHISFDGVQYGKIMAETLIESMGGSGGIVALGGILSNVPAIERKAGMEAALKDAGGKVELLDFQVANWTAPEAFAITQAWLTRFSDNIKGIWAANDEMAMGALEALRGEGKAGQIPITGIDGTKPAIDAVKAGDLVGTVDWDPLWVGGMGLSLAYNTKTGKIDIAKEPELHREFYGTGVVVTQKNIDEFLKNAANPAPIDYNDFWGRVQAQIRYS
ncbi:MAG: sugar ABC transporter substrate-binding protein [Geminicoccaceae bacterium]